MEYFRFGVKLTIGFLVIGTLIMILFYFTLSPKVAMFAYLYTGAAILINWIYTAFLLVNLLRGKISAVNTLKTVGLMALAIPVALLYAYIMIILMSYARITFKNTTAENISLITIAGCEPKEIRNLNKGESKTIWIKLIEDCRIDINYEYDGKSKRETVARYLLKSGGIAATYEIGSNKDVVDGK